MGAWNTLNLWIQRPGGSSTDVAEVEPRTQRPLLKIVVLRLQRRLRQDHALYEPRGPIHAARGYNTALLPDTDPQGSSLRWLANRGEGRPGNHRAHGMLRPAAAPGHQEFPHAGIAAREPNGDHRGHRQRWIRSNCRMDSTRPPTPLIIIPCAAPPDIDIHAASRCIADLLLTGRIENRRERVAVVAELGEEAGESYVLRRSSVSCTASASPSWWPPCSDSQNYIHAVEQRSGRA